MSAIGRRILWAAVIVLGGFLPVWWYLVFTGYYDDKMSEGMILYFKSFLVSDLMLGGLVAAMMVGVLRGKLWGYICGFVVCGIGLYMTAHGLAALWDHTFPRDAVTLWLYGSNAVGLPVVLIVLIGGFRTVSPRPGP